jgi:hypothetical protein
MVFVNPIFEEGQNQSHVLPIFSHEIERKDLSCFNILFGCLINPAIHTDKLSDHSLDCAKV